MYSVDTGRSSRSFTESGGPDRESACWVRGKWIQPIWRWRISKVLESAIFGAGFITGAPCLYQSTLMTSFPNPVRGRPRPSYAIPD